MSSYWAIETVDIERQQLLMNIGSCYFAVVAVVGGGGADGSGGFGSDDGSGSGVLWFYWSEIIISCTFMCVSNVFKLEFSFYHFLSGYSCRQILFKFVFIMKYFIFFIYGD